MLILIIIFIIKDTKLYVTVVTISAGDNQKLSNFLVKDLKDQFIRMNKRQKGRVRIQQRNIDICSNQVFVVLIDFLF